MPIIDIKNLKKAFDKNEVTKGLDLTVNEGEFLAIIGRSGEGKSVLLKQLIGLIKPDHGKVVVNGIEVSKLEERDLHKVFEICGYVFQFAALLDSLTVFENIGIAQLEAGQDPDEVETLVVEKLESVGLSADTLHKYPSELSGGHEKKGRPCPNSDG